MLHAWSAVRSSSNFLPKRIIKYNTRRIGLYRRLSGKGLCPKNHYRRYVGSILLKNEHLYISKILITSRKKKCVGSVSPSPISTSVGFLAPKCVIDLLNNVCCISESTELSLLLGSPN